MADNAKPVELTSEELKSVAGGRIKSTSSKKSASFFGNMSRDSKFLNVLLAGRAGCCDRYGVFKVFFNTSEVISAWNSVGIQIGPDNGYYLDGKKISRSDAYAHAQSVIGKTLQESDWDW